MRTNYGHAKNPLHTSRVATNVNNAVDANATEYLSLKQVAAVYGISLRTVYGYCDPGFKLKSGQVLRLKAIRVGDIWRTTRAWMEEFSAACTADAQRPRRRKKPKVITHRAATKLLNEL